MSITLVLSASQIALGTASPYTAERASFNARIGYPVGPDAAAALTRFDHKPATHRPHLDLSPAQRYSLLYFFVGRHSGLLAYFPLALAMIYLLIRRPSRLGLVMLATAAALATFYLLYTPHNYFGGSTFIGNRYFLVAYPALLIGLRELPSTRILIATLGVGLVFATSAVGSVRRTRDLDHSSQSHAAAGAFRRLPYETTARHIQGQRYRFWSGDYLRFTDAFATVQRRRFLLHSDRAHTELMIARSQVPPRMVFFVRPAELAGRLAYRSAAGIGWNRPASLDPERPGVVAIETERTWRQHPLGWSSRAVYDLRILELKLDPGGGEGEPRQAEVYYLGRDAAALDAFAAEVVSSEIPEAGSAGGRGVARLEVRNTGRMIWSPEDVLPVAAGYRVIEGEAVVSTGKGPIETTVGPGATAVFEIGIDWPAQPGDYRLVLDLEQHPIERLEAAERAVAVRARR